MAAPIQFPKNSEFSPYGTETRKPPLHRAMDCAAKCFRPWRRWRNPSPQLRQLRLPRRRFRWFARWPATARGSPTFWQPSRFCWSRWCVGRFARYSASPGSLYTYASMILPPLVGRIAAWSLLLAYVGTGASVIGGFYQYANVMLRQARVHAVSGRAAYDFRDRRLHVDRLARRENFRAADAVDRSCLLVRDLVGRGAGAGAPRLCTAIRSNCICAA